MGPNACRLRDIVAQTPLRADHEPLVTFVIRLGSTCLSLGSLTRPSMLIQSNQITNTTPQYHILSFLSSSIPSSYGLRNNSIRTPYHDWLRTCPVVSPSLYKA